MKQVPVPYVLVMCWRMERSRSIRRMLDWSQDHKRKVLHAALMEEGANPKEVTIITKKHKNKTKS